MAEKSRVAAKIVSCIRKLLGRSNIDCQDKRHIWSPGTVIQDTPHIHIGRNVWIGPNVGIFAIQHNVNDICSYDPPEDVYIGDNCWIGMNSVILPGVCLGDHTIVGAGAVVTHSFPEGNSVIAGNPAKLIRVI